jgi:sec-independent protein translocase protein TatA
MGELSVYHWLIVLFIVVFLFGGRQIPGLMRGIGEGIRSLRAGISGSAKAAETSSDSDKK